MSIQGKIITKFIPQRHNPLCENRLQQILKNPPPHIPKLYSYGWTSADRSILVLKLEYIEGYCLKNYPFALESQQISAMCKQALDDWKKHGFVHGDLSKNNTILQKNQGSLRAWFIDWTLIEKTPQNDLNSMSKILNSLGP